MDQASPLKIKSGTNFMQCLLLTSQEAADLLKISVRKLQQLSKDGSIRRIKIGHLARYTQDDLIKWITRQNSLKK